MAADTTLRVRFLLSLFSFFSLKTEETYAPLLKSARRSFAPLQKSRRNHHSYVLTEALSGIVVVWAQKLSNIV